MDFDDQPHNQNSGESDENAGSEEQFDIPFLFDEEHPEASDQNDAVIFVIDCAKPMHLPKPGAEGGKNNLSEVLNAACSFMKTKIISSNKDRIGIVFHTCQAMKNPLDLASIHVFRALEIPDATIIKDLEKYSREPLLFESTFCPVQVPESQLSDVFSVCHHLFQGIEKLNYSKRIFLFTNNDNPNGANKHEQARAIQKMRDLYEQDVDIELFPMQGTETFEVAKFYADLIAVDPEQLGALSSKEATNERFLELTKRIRQKEFKKRTLGKTMLHLSPSMDIAVKIFSLVQEAKKPVSKNLDAKTNKQLKTVSRYICQETGAVLYQDQIGTHYPYGGEKVLISKEEMKAIKKFDDPGIKLMGFKPRSSLKDYMNIRASYFISPDDDMITNSSQVMDALIRQMIQKEKIAIVRVIPKETSIVRFCALLPQLEAVDPDDGFKTPQGFNMIFLPYADDIRSPETVVPANIQPKITEEQIKAAKLLIKNLAIEFDSRQFENPAIQKFYSAIQALALGEAQPEHIKDIMQPDYEGMSKFASIIEQFKATFDGTFDTAEIGKGGAKPRKRNAKEAGLAKKAPAKKAKKAEKSNSDNSIGSHDEEEKKPKKKPKKNDEDEKSDESIDILDDRINEENDELKEKFEDGTIQSYSVAQLKDIVVSRRLKAKKNTKEGLLETLKKYLKIE